MPDRKATKTASYSDSTGYLSASPKGDRRPEKQIALLVQPA